MGSPMACVGARCQAKHGQQLRNSWEVTEHSCQLEERRNSWEKEVFRRNLKMIWDDKSMNKWWPDYFNLWRKKKRGKIVVVLLKSLEWRGEQERSWGEGRGAASRTRQLIMPSVIAGKTEKEGEEGVWEGLSWKWGACLSCFPILRWKMLSCCITSFLKNSITFPGPNIWPLVKKKPVWFWYHHNLFLQFNFHQYEKVTHILQFFSLLGGISGYLYLHIHSLPFICVPPEGLISFYLTWAWKLI